MKKMKKIKKMIAVLSALALFLSLSLTVSATADLSLFGSSLVFKDGTYEAYYDKNDGNIDHCDCWEYYKVKNRNNELYAEYKINDSCDEDVAIRLPDSITAPSVFKKVDTKYITSIHGSSMIKLFDINPENKYMKLVDNVVFSKDGKTLMSYARYDERKIYKMPEGTAVVEEDAFRECQNIIEIEMPDSVTELRDGAFAVMYSLEKVNIPPSVEKLESTFDWDTALKEVIIPENSKLKSIGSSTFYNTALEELTLPNFEVKISDTAFRTRNKFYDGEWKVKLKSYVKPEVSAVKQEDGSYRLKWSEVPKASYYEVYKVKKNGSYKLMKTVRGNSVKLSGLKNGKSYTYAVKAYAEKKTLPDKNYDKYIQYYTVEGAMSDSVKITP